MVIKWLVLLAHYRRALSLIPPGPGAFLGGFCMFSLCLCGFSQLLPTDMQFRLTGGSEVPVNVSV